MARKSVCSVALLAVGLTIGVVGSAFLPGNSRAKPSNVYEMLTLLGTVFQKVRTDYVEVPDDQKLIKGAINGMLASLDPHSGYIDQDTYNDIKIQTRGEFGGVGVEVVRDDIGFHVIAPIDGTPAARGGILAKDYIIEIDGKSVKNMSLTEAISKMRGKPGTKLRLKILRREPKQNVFDVVLSRSIITINAVHTRVIHDTIGMIRLTQFNEQAANKVEKAIHSMTEKIGPSNITGFILDLRNNPGGLLDQGVKVAEMFLPFGEIVSTRSRKTEDDQRFFAKYKDLTEGKPLVLLINGGSASASEIVAGALQDHKRAKVIGTRSFGKGSVQTIIPISGQGAIRLTTARYFTPSGRSIQAQGIDPDIVVNQASPKVEEGADLKGEASLYGHLKQKGAKEYEGSSSYVPSTYEEDLQLQAAVSYLEHIGKSAPNVQLSQPVHNVSDQNINGHQDA